MNPSKWIVAVALVTVGTGCKKDEPPPSAQAPGSAAPGSPAAPGSAAPPSSTGALQGFEGEVGLSIKSREAKQPVPPLTVSVKGGRIAFRMPAGVDTPGELGQSPRMVINPRDKKALTVVDERRVAMVIDFNRLGEYGRAITGATPGKPAAPSEPPPRVTRTGTFDTVAGYRCEEWDIATGPGERTRVCVGAEAAPWLALPDTALTADQAWARTLFDGQHFPLRAVVSASGVEQSRIEVTRIEKKPIAESEFEIPAGYQVVDMSDLTKMLGGLATGAASAIPQMNLPPEAAAALKRAQEQIKNLQQNRPR